MSALGNHEAQRSRIDREIAREVRPSSPRAVGRAATAALVAGLTMVGLVLGWSGHAWWSGDFGFGNARVSGDDGSHAVDHAAVDDEMAGSEEQLPAHSHAGETATLSLSSQGRKNIGLQVAKVELSTYARRVSMPATVVERSGQTVFSVSAPLTGIVTRIYTIRGEAVLPGAPMFDLRLTHEDLVEKQGSLLRALEELDVVNREVARLEDVTASGAVAGKRLLETQYEQQRIEAAIRAERQALLLHGLDEEQIQRIVDTRQLHQELTVVAPPLSDDDGQDGHVEYLQVAEMYVKLGEHVATGTQLAAVTDHCELLVEGKAFEQDAAALNEAANKQADVTALFQFDGAETHEVPGLRILYVENQVERVSRALKFYVRLPNELVRNERAGGHRFIGWRYRPGQRVELLVPVEQWEKRIVLPLEAVIQEGAEAYVYLECGEHFDRQEVHVEYRDQRYAVVENDGTLFPGDTVVVKGAYQIHLALKNQSSGGADAHAGHHH